jgi:hypothetical protein
MKKHESQEASYLEQTQAAGHSNPKTSGETEAIGMRSLHFRLLNVMSCVAEHGM